MVMGGLNKRGFHESYRCVNQFLTDIEKQVLFSCHVGWTHAMQLTWQKYEENFNQTIMGSYCTFLERAFHEHGTYFSEVIILTVT